MENTDIIKETVETHSTQIEDSLRDLDTKIILKTFKVGRFFKTSISGLHDLLSKSEQNKIVGMIKKKLGCGSQTTLDESGKTIIIFTGDHQEIIRQILLAENVISASKIEMRGI